MCFRYLSLASVLFIAFTTGTTLAEDASADMDAVKKVLVKFVRAPTTDKAKKYLEKSKTAGATDDQLTVAAKARYKRQLAKLKATYIPLEALVNDFIKKKTTARFFKEFNEWKKASQAALGYMFDNKTYPVPAKLRRGWIPGRDIQTNQAIVEGMAEEVISQWNPMIGRFCRHARISITGEYKPGGGGFAKRIKGTPPENLKKVRIRVLKYKFSDPGKGTESLMRKAKQHYPVFSKELVRFKAEIKLAESLGVAPEKLTLKALALAVPALLADNIGDAMTYKPKSGTEEGIVFALYTRLYLYAKTVEQPRYMSKAAHSALRTNNLYRLSLGLFPLLPNEELTEAADEHSALRKKNGLGRIQDNPKPRPEEQSKPADDSYYKEVEPENYNIFFGPMSHAIWCWRTNAGNHRNLLRPSLRVVGLSDKGPPTHITGSVCEDKTLAWLFTVSYGREPQ